MENEEAKHSGVLGTVSKSAGAGLGTVAKVGGTVKNLLTRPIDDIEHDVDEDEQVKATTQSPALKPEIENTTPGEDELVSKIAALESDLAEVRSQLAEAQNQVKDMQSQFASQLSELQTEKDSLIFDLEQATKEVNESKSTEATLRARVIALESELDAAKGKSEKPTNPLIYAKPLLSEVDTAEVEQDTDISEKITAPKNDVKVEEVIEESQPESVAVESDIPASEESEGIETKQADLPEQQHKEPVIEQTEQEMESSMETTPVQTDEQKATETEAREFEPVIAETSSSVPADVTVEEVNAADFDSATEKIIFINVLSGISSPDKATRIDVIKIMAGIRHELSVRALAAQIAKEPVAQVRAECIKVLAALNMKEGLPAIERALVDEAASVRLAAVWGLYRLAGIEGISAFTRMFSDRDEDVRRRAVTCISWLGKKELAVELVSLLDDRSVSVRLAAVEAMGNLRSRQVVADLIEHLNDTEKIIRKAVISALKTITGRKMSGPFPRDEKSLQILIIRWRQWWRDPASQISPAGTLEG